MREIEVLARKLKFSFYDGISAIGNAGGIALLWSNPGNIQVLVHNKNFLHCCIDQNVVGKLWYLTFIQGPPYPHEKNLFWNSITKLGKNQKGPWMIIGDFNVVLEKYEKWGGKKSNPAKAKRCVE